MGCEVSELNGLKGVDSETVEMIMGVKVCMGLVEMGVWTCVVW
jgi:hypothetical protein